MIAPVLIEAKYVLGYLEGAGAVKGANFAQSIMRADQSFSEEGKAKIKWLINEVLMSSKRFSTVIIHDG